MDGFLWILKYYNFDVSINMSVYVCACICVIVVSANGIHCIYFIMVIENYNLIFQKRSLEKQIR